MRGVAEQMARARQVAERIQAEFGGLIRSFPFEVQTLAEISEWLGVSTPVCQRLVRGVKYRGDLLDIFEFLPGPQGLKQFLLAAKKRKCAAALLEAAEAAARVYVELIDRYGGKRVKFQEVVASWKVDPSSPVENEDAALLSRQKVFDGMAAAMGREFETQVGLFTYAPADADPGRLSGSFVFGLTGLRRRPDAMPLCPVQITSSGASSIDLYKQVFDPDVDSAGGRRVAIPAQILESFCSQPVPNIVARTEHDRTNILIDPDGADGDPVDFALHSYFPDLPDPRSAAPRALHSFVVPKGPSRHLVLDLLLHRSIAKQGIIAAASYGVSGRPLVGVPHRLPNGDVTYESPEGRWFDRMPEQPTLDYLGPGLPSLACEAYPRMPELVHFLMDVNRWSIADFVGYRCHVRYPLWGVQYLLSLDFAEADA